MGKNPFANPSNKRNFFEDMQERNQARQRGTGAMKPTGIEFDLGKDMSDIFRRMVEQDMQGLSLGGGFGFSGRTEPAEKVYEQKKEKPPASPSSSKTLKKLNSMTGMEDVKQAINEIVSFAVISKKRQRMGLAAEPQNYHMVLKGNPGTGKTTVARMIGEIFSELGILQGSATPFVELTNGDLSHPHVGVAEKNVKKKIGEAMGGVLFIDEAYAMVGYSGHNSDTKIVSELVKGMEDYAGQFIAIFAGYEEDMQEFLDFNTGLRSRIPFSINFPDYGQEELVEIARTFVSDKMYIIDETFEHGLSLILDLEKEVPHFGNARTVRNIIEKAIRNQAIRLFKDERDLTKEELMVLTVEDLEEQMRESRQRIALQKKAETERKEILGPVTAMLG